LEQGDDLVPSGNPGTRALGNFGIGRGACRGAFNGYHGGGAVGVDKLSRLVVSSRWPRVIVPNGGIGWCLGYYESTYHGVAKGRRLRQGSAPAFDLSGHTMLISRLGGEKGLAGPRRIWGHTAAIAGARFAPPLLINPLGGFRAWICGRQILSGSSWGAIKSFGFFGSSWSLLIGISGGLC